MMALQRYEWDDLANDELRARLTNRVGEERAMILVLDREDEGIAAIIDRILK